MYSSGDRSIDRDADVNKALSVAYGTFPDVPTNIMLE